MISLQPFGLLELIVLLLMFVAALRDRQFLWAKRQQWTISDWFVATLWIAVFLAVVVEFRGQ